MHQSPRTKKPAKPLKKKTDWEAVHRDYASGTHTDRQLGTKYGLSHTTIARRAVKEGWTQDLSEPIKRATDAAVIRDTVAKLTGEQVPKAEQVVLAAAELNKQVILAHRGELQQTRSVATALLQELSGSALLAEQMDLLAAIMAGTGAEPKDEAQARAAVQKALGITSRINGVKGLADALTKLHAAERIAFSLDAADQNKQTGAMSELLDRMKRSALPVQATPQAEEPSEADE